MRALEPLSKNPYYQGESKRPSFFEERDIVQEFSRRICLGIFDITILMCDPAAGRIRIRI